MSQKEHRQPPAFIHSALRDHNSLALPSVIRRASGIIIMGRRMKSLIFTTDIAIIRNCNADAVLAVYPFTPQQVIMDAIISASSIPVVCGVGDGQGPAVEAAIGGDGAGDRPRIAVEQMLHAQLAVNPECGCEIYHRPQRYQHAEERRPVGGDADDPDGGQGQHIEHQTIANLPAQGLRRTAARRLEKTFVQLLLLLHLCLEGVIVGFQSFELLSHVAFHSHVV